MKRWMIALLFISLLLVLGGCSFSKVESVNLNFYVDGALAKTITLADYRKNGVDISPKSGYELSDWYTDEDLTRKVNWSKVDKDTNLYAKWVKADSPDSHLVVFYDEFGEEVSRCRATTLGEISYPSMPDREDSSFVGWDGLPINLTTDINLYAQYAPLCTVKFFVDGEIVSLQKVKRGGKAETPPNPSKEKDSFYTYTFYGWDIGYTNVTTDLEVKAIFTLEPVLYQITFLRDDGTEIRHTLLGYGDRVTAPAGPTKEAKDGVGYAFHGWDIDDDGQPDSLPDIATGALTAVAVYTTYTTEHTVSFVSDGKKLYTTTVLYGGRVAYQGDAPTKAADERYTYVFQDWDADLSQKVVGDMTINAVFEAIPILYHYAFLAEDGSVLKEGNAEYDTVLMPPEDPAKPDTEEKVFTFAGWFTDDDIAWKASLTLKGDIHYQARYQSTFKQYTVSFMYYGAQRDSYKLHYGDKVIAPEAPVPGEKPDEGKHWEYGWNGLDGDYIVTHDQAFSYYCRQVVNTYTINWVLDDGTIWHTDRLQHGEEITLPDAPTKEGLLFAGWEGYQEGSAAHEDTWYYVRWGE